MIKKSLKIVLSVLLVVLLIAIGYLAYVFIDYHRIGDQEIEILNNSTTVEEITLGKEYKVVSYNIGFGAYESDFGFFMDGGTEAWAWSEERLEKNISNIGSFLKNEDADFYFIQEVDIDSTRSYHYDEPEAIRTYLQMPNTLAVNYDSPFLFYPLLQPHGKSYSSIMTYSQYNIESGVRRELPVENGVMKLLDLDRCYSLCKVPTDNGKYLCLYNLHLSAYTSDGKIAEEQLELLLSDMQNEVEAGNYAVAGGDFNKDLLGDSSEIFGKADKEYTWAQPLPEDMFDGYDLELITPFDSEDPVPSCRNADGPYHQGQFVLTVDGFIVSSNVEMISSNVYNTEFKYSDHNPVYMNFRLIED